MNRPAETLLTLREVARSLGIAESTAQRWLRQGRLPATQGHGDARISSQELALWARAHCMILQPLAQAGCASREDDLASAIRRGGVHFGLRGRSIPKVLEEIVSKAPLNDETARKKLLALLIEREKLASTAISGVALPHPRAPVPDLVPSPHVVTCFLEDELDFHAVDGEPVFVISLLLSPSTSQHLQTLARLGAALREPGFISFLKGCRSEEELVKRVAGTGGP